jgi:hypothetical protein
LFISVGRVTRSPDAPPSQYRKISFQHRKIAGKCHTLTVIARGDGTYSFNGLRVMPIDGCELVAS